jgi:hypothetical protein
LQRMNFGQTVSKVVGLNLSSAIAPHPHIRSLIIPVRLAARLTPALVIGIGTSHPVLQSSVLLHGVKNKAIAW